jgi:hypothetical protein
MEPEEIVHCVVTAEYTRSRGNWYASNKQERLEMEFFY